ncbi:hypothetical protein D3C74_409950 [compost metagenome]
MRAVLYNLHSVINGTAGNPGKRDSLLNHITPFNLYSVKRMFHRCEITIYTGSMHISETISPAVPEYLNNSISPAAYNRLNDYVSVSSQHS